MKNAIFAACFISLLMTPMTLIRSQEFATNAQQEGIFVVSVKNGIINIVSDDVRVPITPSVNDTLSQNNINSIKEAWKKCYAAVLMNEKDTLNAYFTKGLPLSLQTQDKYDGQARILMITQNNTTYKVILKFVIKTNDYAVNNIYDAHLWTLNDKGKWEVKSIIHQ
jgi:hypothetical protein